MLSTSRFVRLSIRLSIRLSVRLSVRVFTFEVLFKFLFAPCSRSRMSNIFRNSESLGKSNGEKWSNIWIFFVLKWSKIAAQKKGFFFADFALVHPPTASVLLSATVKRCFVSRMRDFFFIWRDIRPLLGGFPGSLWWHIHTLIRNAKPGMILVLTHKVCNRLRRVLNLLWPLFGIISILTLLTHMQTIPVNNRLSPVNRADSMHFCPRCLQVTSLQTYQHSTHSPSIKPSMLKTVR